MLDHAVLVIGGLICGLVAGAAAQYGRLCTFAAVEDFIAAGDLRRARAWALALAVAILATQALIFAGLIDPAATAYTNGRLELASLIVGAVMFGVGMALVGTCGFGLLVRAGAGDLRAILMALILGIAAFAATGGPLAPARLWLNEVAAFHLGGPGAGSLPVIARHIGLPQLSTVAAIGIPTGLAVFALWGRRALRRPRLLVSALLLGAAVSGGWLVTGVLADPFSAHRVESLTFVAPIGRVLLVAMGESITNAAFAVMSVFGVVAGSFAVATARDEFRWEAFDDQREMRRHMLGAVLMGIGGVLARGCTIGQGMSAFSMLALSAPIAIVAMMIGARIGLAYLIHMPSWSRLWARQS